MSFCSVFNHKISNFVSSGSVFNHKVSNFVSSCSVFNHKVSNFVSSCSVFTHKVSNFVFCFGNVSPDTPHLACAVCHHPLRKERFCPHWCNARGTCVPSESIGTWSRTTNPEYWRVKITITNFNYRLNYSQWNMVAQHPNLDNITQIFSFNYKSLTPYAGLSKTNLLYCSISSLSVGDHEDWFFLCFFFL